MISNLAEDPDEVTAATAARSCKLTPEVTEGPFYVALDRIRKDITEGRPGVPLTLKIRVIDIKKCAPIHGAAVDIWHCDAGGLYSDEASNGTSGQTYLRGVQAHQQEGRRHDPDDLSGPLHGPRDPHPPQGPHRR